MDPLSLAVSIVPVAEQLVKTIKTIKKLISTYKSAAKELETLTSRLGHVEVICESIGTVLETACLSKNLSEARLPTSLYQMIHECYEKVTVIHDVIQNITESRDRGCRRFSNEGLLFMQHKDKIIAGTKSLDKSLEYLHLLLTTSIFTMSMSFPPSADVTVPSENSPSDRSSELIAPSQTIDSNCIDTSPISTDTATQLKQVETISEGWRRSFLQFAFLQKSCKRSVTTDTSGSGPSVTDVDSVLTVGSTWLNRYIKLSLRQDHLTPLCVTLTLPLVIPIHYRAGSLGTRVHDAFNNDNVDAVRQLFNERAITPTTLITWDKYDPDHECNMLGLAAIKRAPRLLDFMRSQMARVEETAHFGGGSWRWCSIRTQGQLQSAIDYVNIRKNAITPYEVDMLLLGVRDFRHLKACMDAYLSWRLIIPPELNDLILERLLDTFMNVNFADNFEVKGYAAITSELIARGLDVFNGNDSQPSIFTLLTNYVTDSDKGVEDIHRWLDILKLAGVDIEQYLRFETPRCVAAWNKPSANWHTSFRGPDSYINRNLHVGDSKGRLIPFWRDSIDKSCLIHELLMEFPHFIDLDDFRFCTNAEQTMRYHRAWKNGQDLELFGPEKLSWPVAPVLRVDSQPDDPILAADITEEYKIALEWTERAYNLMKSRFERKQMRKMQRRQRKGKTFTKVTLPGAWVD
ncbi:hypothetical protein HYE67_001226 [Fusarium culmorum]|uniref:Fungal N-terminal domain-containing protein n=1 Tax=Fusarium culmorum TaxID=5516 RepID=A0A7S8CZ62_FUSCU|nr:hypothetical protein HYE67_001226 [Fusarium culmorum]